MIITDVKDVRENLISIYGGLLESLKVEID